jgi:hypothetical protein
MTTWIFTHPDTWTQTAPAPAWSEGEGADEYMARLGYAPHSRARNSDLIEFVGAWMLYTPTSPEAPHAYVLLVDGAQGCLEVVFLPALPDLLAYMAIYGELGQANWDRDDRDAMHTLLNKLFRAWHGHDATAFCRTCDPDQYERWQQR